MRRLIHGRKYDEFEPEYRAVLNRADFLGYTMPSSSQNISNNHKVKKLKQAGIWSNLSVLWYCRQESGLSDFATLNWINPTIRQLNQPTPSLVPVYVPGSGFTGGSGRFFWTGYFLSEDDNIDKNDASLFWKTFNFPNPHSGNSFVTGGRNADNGGQVIISSASNIADLFRLFSGQNSATNQADFNKHRFQNKLGNTTGTNQVFQEGIFLLDASNTTPGDKSNREITVLSYNNNGTIVTNGNAGGLSYLAYGNGTGTYGKQVSIYEIMEEII